MLSGCLGLQAGLLCSLAAIPVEEIHAVFLCHSEFVSDAANDGRSHRSLHFVVRGSLSV